MHAPSPISMANVQVLTGRFPTFIFSSPALCLRPLSVCEPLASCCYCSLMRPQSGPNYSGCGNVEEKNNEELQNHRNLLSLLKPRHRCKKKESWVLCLHTGKNVKCVFAKKRYCSDAQNSVAQRTHRTRVFLAPLLDNRHAL